MSRTTEETEMPDIVFKGTDGNECEAFVVAIQDFAFAKGLDENHHWMLRLARTRLRGKALRWYATLDQSIKKDWELFVQALFDQYPLVAEQGDAEIATPVWSATTFSPAPPTVALPSNPGADRNVTARNLPSSSPRKYDASSTGQQIGLLRIVNEERTTIPQYVWWDHSIGNSSQHYLEVTTTNRHEALVVGFLPSSTPHNIGCMNASSGMKTLTWYFNSNSPEYYRVLNSSNSYVITAPAAHTYGCVGKAWNVLADGTLQVSLSSFSQKSAYEALEETKFTTTEVHVDTAGDNIRFVKPGAPLEQDKPKGSPLHPFVRARIVFEPL